MQRNNLVTTIPILSTEWIVSFDIKLFAILYREFGNIIHFTTGGNSKQFGYRIPAVFTQPGEQKFFIQSDAVEDNQRVLGKTLLEIGKKYHVEVHQRYIAEGKYKIFAIIDGVVQGSIITHNNTIT